ncbi:hypothetical protein [Streptomyces sp. KL116D]|uniref:hypothetical protein n=1 Tax=Streptomyces sp. KL116D TaxID=3045152 RepID=UPI003558EAA7
MSPVNTPLVNRPVASRVGTWVCAVLLVAGNAVGGFVTATAYAAGPAGPWDGEGVTHVRVAAGLGVGVAVLVLLLTLLFVKAEWLRSRWWYLVPVLLGGAALVRLTVFPPSA